MRYTITARNSLGLIRSQTAECDSEVSAKVEALNFAATLIGEGEDNRRNLRLEVIGGDGTALWVIEIGFFKAGDDDYQHDIEIEGHPS